jgi:hypothetical protein
MFRSDAEVARNTPLRRLPSIRGGVTFIWLEDSSLSSPYESGKTIARLRALKDCYILHYTTVSKCIKYLKRARSYESIILVLVISGAYADPNKASTVITDVSRLSDYHQVQSILILSSTSKEIDSNTENDSLRKIQKDTNKLIGIFHDHQSIFCQMEHLISETEESDDGLFSAFNRREKALRDVRHELGAFVWSHSYRGQCSSPTNCMSVVSKVRSKIKIYQVVRRIK